jgi:hypothetical protein
MDTAFQEDTFQYGTFQIVATIKRLLASVRNLPIIRLLTSIRELEGWT